MVKEKAKSLRVGIDKSPPGTQGPKKSKPVEEELKDFEAKYRIVADNTYDFEFWINPEGQFIYASPSCKRITGHKAEDLLKDPFLHTRLVHPDDRHILDRHIEDDEKKRKASEVEFRIIHADSSVRWISHACQPVFSDKGVYWGVQGSNRHITKRKLAEEALRESEDRLRFALETSHTGAWDLDLADHTAYRSLEHDRIFGYSELLPQWTYEMFLDHVLPEDRSKVDAKFQHATETQSDWNFECRIRRTDGEFRWIWAAGRHRHDASGSVRRMAGIVQDITDRKRIEEELRSSRDRLEKRVKERTAELLKASLYSRSLIEASLDPLVTISAEEKVMDVNRATELVTGVTRDQLIGSDFSDYFTEPEKAREGYKQVFSEGSVRDYPLAIRHTSGRVTEVLYNATTYKNEAGQIEGVFAAARDITERKRVEEALRESEKRLRHLSSQLLATQEKERRLAAQEIHDSLGASLAAIKFKVESALSEIGGSNPQTRDALESVISIVQETIEEARRIQMSLRPSVLDDLGILATIHWFCRQFESTYPHIRIRREINIEESEVPDSLKTVIFRISQEALNNIAKHSKANRVNLSLGKMHGAIELRIQDNGEGFNPGEAGSRVGATRGLGLDSMRERTELAQGSFSIESSKGSGTVIRVSWPLNS